MENEPEIFPDGSNRLIQHQLSLSSDVDDLKDRLFILEEKMGMVLKNQQQMLRLLRLDKQPLPPRVTGPRRYSRQSLRRKGKSRQSPCDISELLHLPDAIQSNIDIFINQLAFDHSELQDELIAKECLSEDECEVIRSKPSQKDQIRLLIMKLKHRGPEVIKVFLEILNEKRVYQQILDEVSQSLSKLIESTKDKPACVICVMKNTVDVKDIADYLWKKKLISDELFGDIALVERTHRYRREFWDHITHSVNTSDNRVAAFETLKSALEKSTKYKHIAQFIKDENGPNLECICCKRRSPRPRHDSSLYGSVSDISTTSSRPPDGKYIPTPVPNDFNGRECEDSSALDLDNRNLTVITNEPIATIAVQNTNCVIGVNSNHSPGVDKGTTKKQTLSNSTSFEFTQDIRQQTPCPTEIRSRNSSKSSSWEKAADSLSEYHATVGDGLENMQAINSDSYDRNQSGYDDNRSQFLEQDSKTSLELATDEDSASETGSYALEYNKRRRRRGHQRRNYQKRQTILKSVGTKKQSVKESVDSTACFSNNGKHISSQSRTKKNRNRKRRRHGIESTPERELPTDRDAYFYNSD